MSEQELAALRKIVDLDDPESVKDALVQLCKIADSWYFGQEIPAWLDDEAFGEADTIDAIVRAVLGQLERAA